MFNVSPSAISAENENQDRRFVAVASLDGANVNQHLGAAERVLIYQFHPDDLKPLYCGRFGLRHLGAEVTRAGRLWRRYWVIVWRCWRLLAAPNHAKCSKATACR